MRAVWDLGKPVPAREVHDRVARSRDGAHLMVITVLNKLVDKGLLARAKRDDLFMRQRPAARLRHARRTPAVRVR